MKLRKIAHICQIEWKPKPPVDYTSQVKRRRWPFIFNLQNQSSKETKSMAVTAGKYVKNLSHCFASGIRIPVFPFSRAIPSPFSSTIHKRTQFLTSSSLITHFSSSSASSLSSSDYTSEKYLSVRIRCRKDIVVRFNSGFDFVCFIVAFVFWVMN